jgi:ATP-dependent RNA helicase DDX10/DBP4
MGFSETMNSIIANLPTSRQTLLFSATQTKSIKDLARLSLKNPTYVSVHEHASICTPKNLAQTYVMCDIHEKLSFLWSFIRNHLNQKIIVFFQSCKQVNF